MKTLPVLGGDAPLPPPLRDVIVERFVWPRDEDGLIMAFMTGA